MPALLGFLVVSLVTGALVARLTHWSAPPGPRRATLDLADSARKLQSVLSSLAGFAITSIVLLITFAGSRLNPAEERTIDLIALLVVAYLGFVVGGIMYAHTEPIVARDGTDMLAIQHATASTQFYRSIVQGWLALAPLVAIVGVDRLTTFVLALLLIAVLGGWIFNAANLTAIGYATPRFAVLSPMLGLAGAGVFAVLTQVVPTMHHQDSVLFLVGAGAVMGATAHFLFHAARLVGDGVPSWATRWLRALASADAHASVVLMAFQWLAIAGFI